VPPADLGRDHGHEFPPSETQPLVAHFSPALLREFWLGFGGREAEQAI
ncbi:MAG: hypothetical protein AVDCRST_MAG15-360, partial [uncultured Rubellimicrobium sp.]